MRHAQLLTLSEGDRLQLEQLLHRGQANARPLTRARILMQPAYGWTLSDYY
ncbi:MAG: hypothetical protein H0X24_25365 [Ktedonobacterales bacterium]|nr:hypothetical protein [Ktedonobacterales bacterium]